MNIRYDIKDSLLTLAIIVSYLQKRGVERASERERESDKKANNKNNNTRIHLIFYI